MTVHLADPALPGAGAVWRPDQSRHLLMNTVASQITLYTDASSRIDGPVEPGPALHEWARGVAAAGEGSGEEAWVLAEARRLGPDAYPTRAFYGRYLHDCFRRVVAGAPAHVTVRVHRSRAVALTDAHGTAGGPQTLQLADGTRLDGLDAVVLALGHVPARPTAAEARTAGLARLHGLAHFAPANPADADLSGVAPGSTVLLRGLGLNFFDYMALFTTGRGGMFRRTGDGRLVYRSSGREPRLCAFSRRGVPYHARGENQKGPSGRYLPRLLTPARIAALRARGPVSFTADLWPLIAAEVEGVYYGTLLTALGRDAERAEFTARYLAAGASGEREELLDTYGVPAGRRWDWERIAAPYKGRDFTGRDAFRRWLLDRLRADVRAGARGQCGRAAEGRPRRAARPAQRGPVRGRPRRARRRLPPRRAGALVHAAQTPSCPSARRPAGSRRWPP
ncbi:hypothetical protein GCM10020221_17870 [Streptomyces thioluteus]|uniref:FAD-dependent urate hydroxylase HpyO/Asp monooxygenase CreE-like FAD/NAD(P)-binding domain-containing protein n=1 Tax=Streptomyces thioluteus TaxID=66431 RepID=A0ABN3WMX3_STRTU